MSDFKPTLCTKRDNEATAEFTFRRVRAGILEQAAQIVADQAVDESGRDPTDISYNMALVHAAQAIRRAAFD